MYSIDDLLKDLFTLSSGDNRESSKQNLIGNDTLHFADLSLFDFCIVYVYIHGSVQVMPTNTVGLLKVS